MSEAGSHRTEALFQEALDRPAGERATFLARACGGDATLRAEVELLLANYERAEDGFLARPIAADPPPRDEPIAIGPYRVVGRLGEGGAGVVYEAEQDRPQRRIAVKVLKPGLYGEEQLRRFRLECDVLGQLAHPGIARVFDAGNATVRFASGARAEMPYMAMELIRGRRLLDHVAHASLEPGARLRLFAKICDAVHHAHQQAIIHRDLKPGNVLVDDSGQPKILDFGVARVAGDSRATRSTRTGDVIGTLQYMSPEQLFGEPVDLRTDVYALGVILYELLVGEPPYEVASTSTTITAMIKRMEEGTVPRPSRHLRSCRGDLDAIVTTALAIDPSERYATAADLGEDVRRHLGGEAVHAQGARGWYAFRRFVRRHRREAVVAGAFLLIVLASSVVAWTLYSQARHARLVAEEERQEATLRLHASYISDATSARAAGHRGQRLESLDRLERAATIRPTPEVRDGFIASLALADLELVTTCPSDQEVSVYGLRRTDRAAFTSSTGLTRILSVPGLVEMQRLQGPPHPAHEQCFSPDGRYLAAKYHPPIHQQSDVRFWVWDLERGTTVLRLDAGEIVRGQFGFGRAEAVGEWVSGLQSDRRVHLYMLSSGRHWKALDPPLPDGFMSCYDAETNHMALVSYAGEIAVWDVGTGAERVRTMLPTEASTLEWVPGGPIAIGSPTGDLYLWDPETSDVVRSFPGHQGWVSRVFPSTRGEVMGTSSWDGSTRVWNVASGKAVVAPLRSEEVSGFGDLMLTHDRGAARFYRHVPSLECRRIESDAPFVGPSYANVHSGGRFLATATNNQGIRVWDLDDGRVVEAIEGDGFHYARFLSGPPERLLGFDGERFVSWPLIVAPKRITLGEPTILWTGEGTNHGSATVDVTESRAMLTSPEEIVIFDLSSGERLATLPGYPGVAAPSLDPLGRYAATGKWRQDEMRVYDLSSGEVVLSDAGDLSVIGTFCPDGRHFLVCVERVLDAYEAGTWRHLYRIEDTGRRGTASTVRFAPDGRTALLTGRFDIRLYDHETGERLATLTPPSDEGTGATCFSPDGDEVVGTVHAGAIYRWDLRRIRERLAEVNLDWTLSPASEPALSDG